MRNIKLISLYLLSMLTVGALSVTSVGAESTKTGAAQGLQISPAYVELNAEAGKVYDINLTVTNVTASNLMFNSTISDFTSKDETGAPKIFQDSSMPTSSSIKTWASVVNNFNLTGQQQKKITAQIKVPLNAEPGGHYGVLSFAGSAPEQSGNGVGLSASAGTLLLIRVDGKITEKAELASFYSTNGDKQSSFFEDGKINFVTRVKNEGNVHVKPIGNIEVRDMFGGLVKNFEINSDKKSNVLPKSVRKFDSKLDKGFMFGKYTANLTLGYGTNGQAITSTIDFWVIPYKLILGILAGVALIVFILSKLIKGYNSHIIAKSKNEEGNKKRKRSKK